MLNKFVDLVKETVVVTNGSRSAPFLFLSLSLSFFIEHKRIVDDGIFPNERKEGEDW